MGRPINKRYLGDAADSIKVTDYFRVDGAETAGGDDTYIVSQRSTSKFLIADTSGAWEEILTLVDKDAGTLAEGEFRVDGVDADGGIFNVARFYNRTLRAGSADDTFFKLPWSVGAVADALTISSITPGSPTNISVADTSTITDGETITIDGVVGTMSTINGTHVATVIDATTITVPFDSTGLVRDSGGVVDAIGTSGGAPDLQDA
jgi:hypothetical protein